MSCRLLFDGANRYLVNNNKHTSSVLGNPQNPIANVVRTNKTSWVKPVKTEGIMDHLREFLESSSIHGLFYISTCKSKVAKAGWTLVVALGFSFAFFLIHSSFSDWAESPVATTITPQSVANLQFPNVTICPPKGFNSALRFDLMMTSNMNMSQEKREKLKQKVDRLLRKNIGKTRLDLINRENQKEIFEGQMMLPEETLTEIHLNLAGMEGTVTSPGYNKNFTPELYRQFKTFTKKDLHYTLDLEAMGKEGYLTIEVEMNTNFEDELLFRPGEKYQLLEQELSWEDADSWCQSNGGHLVSILSEKDQGQVEKVNTFDYSRYSKIIM